MQRLPAKSSVIMRRSVDATPASHRSKPACVWRAAEADGEGGARWSERDAVRPGPSLASPSRFQPSD